MASVNMVIILGRLGKEPMKNGPAVKFSVATTEKWKGKDGQEQSRTEWHNITTFGKLSDICLQYLKKGTEVYIQGRLQTDTYDKNGVKTYSTSIIADKVQFLGGGSGQAKNEGGNYNTDASSEDIPF